MDSVQKQQWNILSFTGIGKVLPHTLLDLQDALRKDGHHVRVLDMLRMGRYQRLVAFADTIAFHKPDMIFTIDATGIMPFLLGVLPTPPRIVTWFYDTPLKILTDPFLLLNDCLSIFVWDRAYIEPLRERGFKQIHYQPFATNPVVYFPVEDVSYQYDVSFVGSWSEQRAAWLRKMGEQGIVVDVFGDTAWEGEVCDTLIYHGGASNRKDCPDIYRSSKVNLNITSEQLLTSLPVRIFDVLGCEGFVATDFREDAETLFVPGEDLVVCRNPAAMVEAVRNALDHETERRRIARSGYQKVKQSYTFQKVIPDILDRVPDRSVALGYKNRMKCAADYARAAWIMGMSYVKSGDLVPASELLSNVLHLCSMDDMAVVALCILAARMKDRERVETCLYELKVLDSKWAKHEQEFRNLLNGGEFSLWDELYCTFFNIHGADK